MSKILPPSLYTDLLLPYKRFLFIANFGKAQSFRIIDPHTESVQTGKLSGFNRDPVDLSGNLSFQVWCLSQPETKQFIEQVTTLCQKNKTSLTLLNAARDWAGEANGLHSKFFEKVQDVHLDNGAGSKFLGSLYGLENEMGAASYRRFKGVSFSYFCSGLSENGIRLSYFLMKVETQKKIHYFDVCAKKNELIERLKIFAEKAFIPVRLLELEPETKKVLELNKSRAVKELNLCIVNPRQPSFRVIYPGIYLPQKEWENESLVQRFNRTGFV